MLFNQTDAHAGIAGHWQGAFARQGAVQEVAFDFEQSDSGLIATYDIPEMILFREPVRDVMLSGDSLSLHVFWGTFACLVHDDVNEITGVNAKWGPPVSLHLKRILKEHHIDIQHIRFPSDSLTLAGDLLLPDGNPPFAAVVVVEGSSTGGRKLWTYRSIGDLFARNGIAALVYDKRGCGESDGDLASASFEDLAFDVENAVSYLAGRDDIDASTIGLFGISQGGWLAPLAEYESGKASFIIMLGGPAVSVWEQELERVEYSMRAGIYGENEPDKFSEKDINDALAHTRLGFEAAQHPDRWDEWVKSVQNAKTKPWSSYVGLDSTLDELQGWLLQRYDPAQTLKSIDIPILALFGENDVMVPPGKNVPLLQSYLKDSGNEESKIVVFPGVGHDFFTGATLVGGDWAWPGGFWRWNRRAVGLGDTIVNWAHRQTRQ